ncbi:chromosome segregation protein SMC [Acinetobacter sp. YH16032]|uniref:chromosome segregation protein SMC n=1 Tax=Acinetobacter sp. YH16032 TaxID=2601181 RepID=UPI0015D1D48D|nr:chromosome segregation protein SMC [Acinetobacter sp. YH16032]
MRLSSLKLSGFKSFADSSTLQFKANRTAVVGPNGCGKSNVIDAIRWVMGESSARQLRGGSMQDVIFTGTAKRKPVGMASVELRFENTYGKLGGAYNAYSELAVRRQVNRDGKSEYFLNGTKCRRRDITDIFLGTGLGPRSYAIIEQGMINRLVDAKPDEMRVYIEEAAGVSRYQARRRETMQHLEHTHQNLSRLNDIAVELKSQLKTLKRQAEAALQYKALETEIRTLKVEILSFQCHQSERIQQEYTTEMTELGEQFKLVRSELTTVEHDLTATNELFQRLMQQSTPLQQEWQQAEKKLAELQANLDQKQQLFAQNTLTLKQLEEQKIQTKERMQLIDIQLEDLILQQEHQATTLSDTESSAQLDLQQFNELKAKQLEAQKSFSEIKALVEKQQQQRAQMLAQSDQLAKNVLRIEQQKQTLLEQKSQNQAQYEQDDIDNLLHEKNDVQIEIVRLEERIEKLETQLKRDQISLTEQKSQCTDLNSHIQILKSEQKQLQQLVVKVSRHASKSNDPLMQILKLKDQAKPFAALVEKFLSKWLHANTLKSEDLFQTESARQLKVIQQDVSGTVLGLPTLASWIDFPQNSLWLNVAIAQDFEQALQLQPQLKPGESILSLDGYHIGPDWMIGLYFDESSQDAQGALSHRIRLDEIDSELTQMVKAHESMTLELAEMQLKLEQKNSECTELQKALKNHQALAHQVEVKIAKQQMAQQAFESQNLHIESQIAQLDAQLEEDAMQKDDLEIDLHALMLKIEHNLPHYKTLEFQVEELNNQVEHLQDLVYKKQQELEKNRRTHTQNQQQIELLEKDASFLKTQYQQIITQITQAKNFVDPIQLELPTLQSQYEAQKQQTEKLQKTWSSWQVELNEIQSKQQKLTELRLNHQQSDEHFRTQLEEKRLAWQVAKSDLQHYAEQLKELNAELLENMQIDLSQHQQQLEQVQRQFDKIGAVNLAASEEYEEVSKRYEDLSHQIEDLEKTVAQLKDAMKSIDQETKKLFMTTFNQVNAELQNLFPKVFNGGEASLSLEDDWQSGVKLMARPPGKRNSSLALLSGGEKALTALALVFAIFRLNPAPFCVLDEVDAPLDDANVGRFCNLVKELSEQVQFIYITHNKVAMTMATDLLGVTMPEPGTSKLVTVDLEEAKEYGLAAES